MADRRKQAVSLKTKVDIILEVDKKMRSKTEIAKSFGIPKSTLSTFLKNRERILSEFEKGSFSFERKRLRKAAYGDLEEALVIWLKSARSKNTPVSGPLLKERAEQLALQMGYEEFRCSEGWLSRFKSRNDLVFRRVCGESSATDFARRDDWVANKLPLLLASCKPCDLFNADETALFYKLLPDKTLTFKGDICSGGKRSKERVTVLVGANMDGSEKLPLLVVGKFAKPRCFKNIRSLPVEYVANKNAWMTQKIFEPWLRKVDARFAAQNRTVTMIVDNCSAHSEPLHLKAIKLVFLPPNTTATLQPMDQGIIQNVKALYRKKLMQRILLCITNNKEYNVDLLRALHLLNAVWQAVLPKTVQGCFRHAGFVAPETIPGEEAADSEDDSEDDENDALLSELREKGAQIPDEVNFNEYVAIDNDVEICEELTDEAIISAIRKNDQVEEEDDDDDDDEKIEDEHKAPPPSTQDACEAVEVYVPCACSSQTSGGRVANFAHTNEDGLQLGQAGGAR